MATRFDGRWKSSKIKKKNNKGKKKKHELDGISKGIETRERDFEMANMIQAQKSNYGIGLSGGPLINLK